MNKKKFLILPIVTIVLSLFSISVLGASPCSGVWHVEDKNGVDVCEYFQGEEMADPGWDLSKVPGLKEAVEAKGVPFETLKYKVGYEVHRDTRVDYDLEGRGPHRVYFPIPLAADEYAIVVHKGANGFYFEICLGPAHEVYINNISDFSPFGIYAGKTTASSPQTGEYAPAYIAMISVALVSCGAIFAIRAKKASK